MKLKKLNWDTIYNDIEKEISLILPKGTGGSIIQTPEDYIKHFKSATRQLELQLAILFKQEIWLLERASSKPEERVLSIIKQKNLQPPAFTFTDDSNLAEKSFHQIGYEAKYNFYDRVKRYEKELEFKIKNNNKNNIKISIDEKAIVREYNQKQKNNTPFAQFDAEKDFNIAYYEITPPNEYEYPKDFPNCCNFHTKVFEQTEEYFSKFPNCCDDHKKLLDTNWFKKENYSDISIKVVTQLSYTEQFIASKIHKQNWFKEITDYVDLNIKSFGTPSIGSHIYIFYLKHFLFTTSLEIIPSKKENLIEYLERLIVDNKDNIEYSDLNVLYKTYQKWLDLLPDEISFIKKNKKCSLSRIPCPNWRYFNQ